jgi:hypothetical protein
VVVVAVQTTTTAQTELLVADLTVALAVAVVLTVLVDRQVELQLLDKAVMVERLFGMGLTVMVLAVVAAKALLEPLAGD